MLTLRIARGRCLPLGASSTPDGVNFALFCRHGTDVLLVVYALNEDTPLLLGSGKPELVHLELSQDRSHVFESLLQRRRA